MTQTNTYTSLLIAGPTGSSKTPLGDYLQAQGLWGKRCFHFDFGNELRRVGGKVSVPPELSEADINEINKVLQQGALLENETFYIAKNILVHFIRKSAVGHDDIIILNGLPRHVDQARDIEPMVAITMVVYLNCTAEIVKERIEMNAGGDRSGRTDDSLENIKRKIGIFNKRTIPLIRYYENKGITVKRVTIKKNTTVDDIFRAINR
jgi:adenylate kinase family enzyme